MNMTRVFAWLALCSVLVASPMLLAAHTPLKDRAVWNRMSWPGLNPDGALNARTLLDYERWLLNEHRIGRFITPGQFVDRSFTQHAVQVLGPAHP